jgi:hypothetical protein
MIFVKLNNYPIAMLRADQIADKLGCKVFLNSMPEKGKGRVVFVKEVDTVLINHAHTCGCHIIYDPIDTYAYAERQKWKDWMPYVDTVIAYNQVQANIYKNWFRNVVIIPHQWDARLDKSCSQDAFKVAYIGHSFNATDVVKDSGIDMVTVPEKMLDAMSEYNCHVSIRDSVQAKMKPATKIANAAAVGAVIITSLDASAKELLPINYPYWCWEPENFERVLNNAREDFGGSTWNLAREMMAEVKEKTSLDTVADMYTFL